jgi:hypothetical protein
MASKSKSRRKVPEPLDLHARVLRHMELTGEMRLLITECTALRDDGKIAAGPKSDAHHRAVQNELLDLQAVK